MSSTETRPSENVVAERNVESINTRIKPDMITGKCMLINDLSEILASLFLKIGTDFLMI